MACLGGMNSRRAQLLGELRAEAKAAALRGGAAEMAAGANGTALPQQALADLPQCVRRYLELSGAGDSHYTCGLSNLMSRT